MAVTVPQCHDGCRIVDCTPFDNALRLYARGENVEDAFLSTAKQIYQNIQDGSLDLNAAESGVQQKSPSSVPLSDKAPPKSGGCC
jgi:hypothetical protein